MERLETHNAEHCGAGTFLVEWYGKQDQVQHPLITTNHALRRVYYCGCILEAILHAIIITSCIGRMGSSNFLRGV